MDFHELSTLFPTFEGQPEFEALVSNMKTYGFDSKFPILTWNGDIIDGRHRYLAAKEAGVEPVYRKMADTSSFEDAMNEAVKANMMRRSLSTAERAMVAGKLANMSKADGAAITNGASLNLDMRTSLADAAKQMNVSRASVAEVRKIKNEAPEVYEKLERGEIKSINAASKEAFQTTETPPEAPKEAFQITETPPVAEAPSNTPMKQQTAKGASGTLMGVLKAIDENFDGDDVINAIMEDLQERSNDPRLVSLMRRRAEAVLNLKPTMEKLYGELETFLADNPQASRIN